MFLDHVGTLISFISLVTLLVVELEVEPGVEGSSLERESLNDDTKAVILSVYLFMFEAFCPEILLINHFNPSRSLLCSAPFLYSAFNVAKTSDCAVFHPHQLLSDEQKFSFLTRPLSISLLAILSIYFPVGPGIISPLIS